MPRSYTSSIASFLAAVALIASFAENAHAERFPPTSALPPGWTKPASANASWIVTNTSASEGQLSLKAEPIGNNETAAIEFAAQTGNGNFTFSRRVSSEFGFDKFKLFLNGTEIPAQSSSGDAPWAPVSVPVRAGRNVFLFVYQKDASSVAGQDTAWIDDIQFPPKTSLSAPGDMNGDGKSDILLTYINGGVYSYFMNGAQVIGGGFVTPIGTALKPLYFADLDSDNRADAVFTAPDGTLSVGIADANGKLAVSELPFGSDRKTKLATDVNGDGRDDIVLDLGGVYAYVALMDGPIAPAGGYVFFNGGQASFAGDFNGDGKKDLLSTQSLVVTSNSGAGYVAFWYSGGMLDGDWKPIHVVDLNGDGKSEVISRREDGTIKASFYSEVFASPPYYQVATEAVIIGPNSEWTLSHVTDLNGDGKPDFVFTNVDGSIFVYLMDNTTVLSAGFILGANTGWKIVQVGDYNGDRKSDLLLRHTNGSLFVYLMNGANVAGGGLILGADSGWTPAP